MPLKLRVWLSVGAVCVFAGCTAQPLYAPDASTPGSVSQFKGQVNFAQADSRLEQYVRDTMIFRLNGGGDSSAPNPKIEADLQVTSSTAGRFRVNTRQSGQTSAALVTVRGTLTLSDPETGKVTETIKRSAIAPFDRNQQDFANERAELDARERAARELGEQFATLLAVRLKRLD